MVIATLLLHICCEAKQLINHTFCKLRILILQLGYEAKPLQPGWNFLLSPLGSCHVHNVLPLNACILTSCCANHYSWQVMLRA